MTYPNLYRKRIIPKECIPLKDDQIISYEDHKLITVWHALKPRKDLHHGISCYFFDEGFKISKFYRADGSLLYWYCDIIDYEFVASSNDLIVTDLLADVIVYPDGFVKVVDLAELVDALEEKGISQTQLKHSLTRLDQLLSHIYAGSFQTYQAYLESFEKQPTA